MEKIITDIIKRAGKIMLSAHLEEDNSDGAVSEKWGSANFVTKYDVAVQDFIMSEIKKSYPRAVFIAEEKENDPRLLSGELCFVIDPIDGTKNFINDYRHSCISIAAISGGETVLGAVYDPYLDELFIAEKGKGARLNGKKMTVSERPFELAIAAYGTSPYYKDTLAEATFALTKDIFMAASDIRRTGSAALDLAYLAAGRNDLFFEMILSPWDVAAGALLVTEAGGLITDINGRPIDLSSASSVFAGNRDAHPRLLAIAEKYR
ncbi:MAG: inositol monophosphatase [Clostridia bacterium]|nr:inositol monophosphatase [Clostridia bacterium]